MKRNLFLESPSRPRSGYFRTRDSDGTGSLSVRVIGPKESVNEFCRWLLGSIPSAITTGGKDEVDTGNYRQYVAVPTSARLSEEREDERGSEG